MGEDNQGGGQIFLRELASQNAIFGNHMTGRELWEKSGVAINIFSEEIGTLLYLF